MCTLTTEEGQLLSDDEIFFFFSCVKQNIREESLHEFPSSLHVVLHTCSILAAYLLHTCKYPHCSRALTFEQNIEQKRTHAWPPGRSQRISRDVCFFCHKCVLVLSVCQLYLLIGYVFLFCFFGKIDCIRRNCSCVRFDRSLNKCLG